jgi:hypothetical protein
MTTEKEIRGGAKKSRGAKFSLDAWAVTLALVVSLLVWIGWIKQVPW